MSVPIRNEGGIDDPLSYAPHWVRHTPEQSTFAHAPATKLGITDMSEAAPRITNAPRMAPGIGGHNIDLPPLRLRRFEGDVAIKDLRDQLSLDPDLVPQPRIRTGRKPAVRWIGSLPFVFIVAAIIAFGVTLMTFLHEARNQAGHIADVVTPLLGRWSRTETLAQVARLVVESQTGFANEPIPLGVSLNSGSGLETVTVAGLAAGTKLSVGTQLGLTGWQVSAHDLDNAFAHAPKDFIGVMDVAVDLRSVGDRLLDNQVVRLEWIKRKEDRSEPEPPKPLAAIQPLDPETIATLEGFLKSGDILSARILLKRGVSAGNAEAALKLGMTFDPIFLVEMGVIGFAPDIAQARAWYERAMQLGSIEASRRLEQLAGMGR
jgi:hypothetical protein